MGQLCPINKLDFGGGGGRKKLLTVKALYLDMEDHKQSKSDGRKRRENLILIV